MAEHWVQSAELNHWATAVNKAVFHLYGYDIPEDQWVSMYRLYGLPPSRIPLAFDSDGSYQSQAQEFLSYLWHCQLNTLCYELSTAFFGRAPVPYDLDVDKLWQWVTTLSQPTEEGAEDYKPHLSQWLEEIQGNKPQWIPMIEAMAEAQVSGRRLPHPFAAGVADALEFLWFCLAEQPFGKYSEQMGLLGSFYLLGCSGTPLIGCPAFMKIAHERPDTVQAWWAPVVGEGASAPERSMNNPAFATFMQAGMVLFLDEICHIDANISAMGVPWEDRRHNWMPADPMAFELADEDPCKAFAKIYYSLDWTYEKNGPSDSLKRRAEQWLKHVESIHPGVGMYYDLGKYDEPSRKNLNGLLLKLTDPQLSYKSNTTEILENVPHTLREWHKAMFEGVPDLKEGLVPGMFRDIRMRVWGPDSDSLFFFAPLPEAVPSLMEQYGQWLNREMLPLAREKSPVDVVLMGLASFMLLVKIHPFLDGNGRASRLLMIYLWHIGGVNPAASVMFWNQNVDRDGEAFKALNMLSADEANLWDVVDTYFTQVLQAPTVPQGVK